MKMLPSDTPIRLLAGQPAPQVLMCHFTLAHTDRSICLFEFLHWWGMEECGFISFFRSGSVCFLYIISPSFCMPLSSNYLLYFTWRVCGPDPLYLHVRSRCVNSWTVGINLKQPRDTLLICGWQLYCFRRHNEPPLNVTLWDCPNTISPSVCFHYAGVWSQCVGPSGTTGSCQRACVYSVLGTYLHSSSVRHTRPLSYWIKYNIYCLSKPTASENQLHNNYFQVVEDMKCK